MYYIEAKYINNTNGRALPYISGVFQSEIIAKEAMKNYTTEGVEFELKISESKSFPVFIIEFDGKFIVTDKKGTVVDFSNGDLEPNEDETYFNLYILESYFVGEKDGSDSMGRLNHKHVDSKVLNRIKNNFDLFLVKD